MGHGLQSFIYSANGKISGYYNINKYRFHCFLKKGLSNVIKAKIIYYNKIRDNETFKVNPKQYIKCLQPQNEKENYSSIYISKYITKYVSRKDAPQSPTPKKRPQKQKASKI